jgi:hypothetical protein
LTDGGSGLEEFVRRNFPVTGRSKPALPHTW